MAADVKLIDGTIIAIDEFNLNKLKQKVQSIMNGSQVVVHITDENGGEFIFPFSSVLSVKVIPEAPKDDNGQAAGGAAVDVSVLSLEQLKVHIETLEDAAQVQSILDAENAKPEPRKGAVKLLEDKLAQLKG